MDESDQQPFRANLKNHHSGLSINKDTKTLD